MKKDKYGEVADAEVKEIFGLISDINNFFYGEDCYWLVVVEGEYEGVYTAYFGKKSKGNKYFIEIVCNNGVHENECVFCDYETTEQVRNVIGQMDELEPNEVDFDTLKQILKQPHVKPKEKTKCPYCNDYRNICEREEAIEIAYQGIYSIETKKSKYFCVNCKKDF